MPDFTPEHLVGVVAAAAILLGLSLFRMFFLF
jgi:hypothetical protein